MTGNKQSDTSLRLHPKAPYILHDYNKMAPG